MYLTTITTGPEAREFNGPLMPPIWNGTAPGYREGQIYYDIAGVLNGTPGPIYWDGANWQPYSAYAGVPSLDAVTTIGNSTGNGINVGYLQAIAPGGTPQVYALSDGSVAGLQAGPDPDNVGQFVSDLYLDGNTNRILITETGDVSFRKRTSNSIIIVIHNDGRITGTPATGANDFVTLSQVNAATIPVSSAVTSDNILSLSYLNGAYPSAPVGATYMFTNLTDNPGGTAFAFKYDASHWSVKVDFIKAS